MASGEGSALNPPAVCPVLAPSWGCVRGTRVGVAAVYQMGLLEDVAVP